jgi:hypothetical protein
LFIGFIIVCGMTFEIHALLVNDGVVNGADDLALCRLWRSLKKGRRRWKYSGGDKQVVQ